MATSKQTVEFLLGQLEPLDVRATSMFGEYALYCQDKVVGFICDELLFVKPSDGDGPFRAKTIAAPPHPRAKDYWLLSGEQVADTEWLQAFVQATADALPAPKPKQAKKS